MRHDFLSDSARAVLIDSIADNLEEICAGPGPNAVPLVANLIDPVDVNGMMPQLLERTGQLDILHANAGSYVGGEVLGSDPDA
jgi:ribitol 2-dehydrogenase